MVSRQTAGTWFDLFASLLTEIFDSDYVNVGYWDKTTKTIADAQTKLVSRFGHFSKLDKGMKIIDVGCGTGEQDLFFLDQFDCDQIVGVDISKEKINLALNKIKNKKRYSKKIRFRVDDAIKIQAYPPATYDRVLALECMQYIPKRAFAQGAFHVLKSNGHLCIAESIYSLPYKIEEKKYPSLLKRIKSREMKKKYGMQLDQKLHSSLLGLSQPLQGISKEICLSFDDQIKVLEEAGFQIDETQEASRETNQFYPVLEERILEILTNQTFDQYQIDLILTYLVASYINYRAFLNGSAHFYFIRALKL